MATLIFPIFDAYPLLTSKRYHYDILRNASNILENETLTTSQRNARMEHLCSIYKIPSDYSNPIWLGVELTPKDLGM